MPDVFQGSAHGQADNVFRWLCLHHFEDCQVRDLLAGFYRVARCPLVSSDLERHILPYLVFPVTRPFFGWAPPNSELLREGRSYFIRALAPILLNMASPERPLLQGAEHFCSPPNGPNVPDYLQSETREVDVAETCKLYSILLALLQSPCTSANASHDRSGADDARPAKRYWRGPYDSCAEGCTG